MTFFDTADTYSGGASEVATGRLVPKFLSRDEAVIATKVFMPVTPGENGGGLGRKHILSGIDASLRRLKMDYVDLYQIHRWDPRTPIEETMEALHDVVRSGKARYIGASSMFSWQFAKAQHTAEAHGWTKFVSMQNHYNLDLPRGGARDDPALPRPGRGVHPVEPAGPGHAGRQPHAGRRAGTRPARAPTRSPTTSTTSPPTSTSSTPWTRWPRPAASRRRRSRWPGCCEAGRDGAHRRARPRRST